MCVCVSVENRLEREIAYSADFFRSQVPLTKQYPVYATLVLWNEDNWRWEDWDRMRRAQGKEKETK